MKNIKRLLVAAFALTSLASVADGVLSANPVIEEGAMRVSGGLTNKWGNMGSDSFHTSSLGLGVGLTHNAVAGFEWGVAVGGDYNSGSETIFTSKASDKYVYGFDADLMARYMPEVFDGVYVGGIATFGYNTYFGKNSTAAKQAVKFGDLNFSVGARVSYDASDAVSIYTGASYRMSQWRFYKDDTPAAQASMKNYHGLEVPVGAWIGFGENAGMFVEVNNRFSDFNNFGKTYQMNPTLGLTYTI